MSSQAGDFWLSITQCRTKGDSIKKKKASGALGIGGASEASQAHGLGA